MEEDELIPVIDPNGYNIPLNEVMRVNRNHLPEQELTLTDTDPFIVHGTYTVSNAGGYEIQLSDCGGSARVRDAYGSDNPKISEWFEIEYIKQE